MSERHLNHNSHCSSSHQNFLGVHRLWTCANTVTHKNGTYTTCPKVCQMLTDIVGKGVMFLWLTIHRVRLFIRSSGQILLPLYLMNGWAILMKLTGNIQQPLPITWIDFGGQWSRSQQAVDFEGTKTSTSMLGCQSPSSELKLFCLGDSAINL